jgi:hypothetical protein
MDSQLFSQTSAASPLLRLDIAKFSHCIEQSSESNNKWQPNEQPNLYIVFEGTTGLSISSGIQLKVNHENACLVRHELRSVKQRLIANLCLPW